MLNVQYMFIFATGLRRGLFWGRGGGGGLLENLFSNTCSTNTCACVTH